MRASSAVYGLVPFLLLALSFVVDWLAIRTFNDYAETIGLQRIRWNFFTRAGALGKIRRSIPQGNVRTKIIALQILSFCFALGFAALMFFSIKLK
jgi:hypothetical protein